MPSRNRRTKQRQTLQKKLAEMERRVDAIERALGGRYRIALASRRSSCEGGAAQNRKETL